MFPGHLAFSRAFVLEPSFSSGEDIFQVFLDMIFLFWGLDRLMLKKMIINANIYIFLSVCLFCQEVLFYKSVSPESSGREGQSWHFCRPLFPFLYAT